MPDITSAEDNKPEPLNGLISSFAEASKAISAGVQNILGATAEGKAAIAGKAKAEQQSGAASAEVSDINQAALMKAKADASSAAATFGTTPGDASSYTSMLATKNQAIQSEISAGLEDIANRQKVKPWDDPIQYLFNNMVIPYKQQFVDTKQKELNSQQTFIKNAQEETSGAAVIANAVDTSASTQMASALRQKIAADATAKSEDALADAAKFSLSAVSPFLAATSGQFDLLFKLNSAQVQQTDLLLNQSRLQIEQSRDSLYEESKKQMIAIREGNEQAKAEWSAGAATVASVVGVKPPSYQMYEKMDPRTRTQWDNWISDPDFRNGMLAQTPAEALQKANDFDFPLTPGANILRRQLVDVESSVVNQFGMSWKGLGKDVQANEVNKAIKLKAINEMHNIPSEGGIYSPPPLDTTLKLPSLQGLPLVEAMRPLANKNYPTKPDDFIATADKLIAKPEDIPAVAAQIAQVYKGVIMNNQSTKMYNLFAFDSSLQLSDKSGFKTTVQSDNTWKGHEVVNMADPANVTSFLTRRFIQRKYNQPVLNPVFSR